MIDSSKAAIHIGTQTGTATCKYSTVMTREKRSIMFNHGAESDVNGI